MEKMQLQCTPRTILSLSNSWYEHCGRCRATAMRAVSRATCEEYRYTPFRKFSIIYVFLSNRKNKKNKRNAIFNVLNANNTISHISEKKGANREKLQKTVILHVTFRLFCRTHTNELKDKTEVLFMCIMLWYLASLLTHSVFCFAKALSQIGHNIKRNQSMHESAIITFYQLILRLLAR